MLYPITWNITLAEFYPGAPKYVRYSKLARSNFAIQSNKENVNILKNGFHDRFLEASEYEKNEGSKNF